MVYYGIRTYRARGQGMAAGRQDAGQYIMIEDCEVLPRTLLVRSH